MKCCLLLFYAKTTDHFSIRLWCVMKSGFYTTASNDWLSGWTKKNFQITSQSQTWARKTSWSLFGHLLLVWSTTAFWIPVKPLHLRSMLSKSMRCSKNCSVCSWHWSIERAQFFSTMMPDCTSHNQYFRSWTNGVTKFCLICHIHLTSRQPNTTTSSISTTFCRENASTTSRRKKLLCFPSVCWILKHRFFFFLSTFPFCFLKYLFIFNWLMIGLHYWFAFCHTSAWAKHRCTYVPSLLNFPPTSCPCPPL